MTAPINPPIMNIYEPTNLHAIIFLGIFTIGCGGGAKNRRVMFRGKVIKRHHECNLMDAQFWTPNCMAYFEASGLADGVEPPAYSPLSSHYVALGLYA